MIFGKYNVVILQAIQRKSSRIHVRKNPHDRDRADLE